MVLLLLRHNPARSLLLLRSSSRLRYSAASPSSSSYNNNNNNINPRRSLGTTPPPRAFATTSRTMAGFSSESVGAGDGARGAGAGAGAGKALTLQNGVSVSTEVSTEAEVKGKGKGGARRYRYIDIGINLTDPVYTGSYHGTRRHPDDLAGVLARAKEAGCAKMIVTGSDLKESRRAVELAEKFPGVIYTTVGVHPCSCLQFTPRENKTAILLPQLRDLAVTARDSGHAVAFGEIGLDYDRLMLCPKDVQLTYFEAQLAIAVEVDLPLFLHSRAAHADFVRLLKDRIDAGGLAKRGVVHSFTGTKEEMEELVSLGFDIGINGCSMKTEENCEVVKAVPLERLQLETDGPWCEIRASHASFKHLKDYTGPEEREGGGTGGEGKGWKSVKKEKWVEGAVVKGRNEPCFIGKVAWAVAGIKGVSVEEVTERAWENTVKMFGL